VQHRRRARAQQQIGADQIAHQRLERARSRQEAVAAEVEAKAVALLGAAQPSDARLTLEDAHLDAGARQRPGGGGAACSAAEDGHAHRRHRAHAAAKASVRARGFAAWHARGP